MHITCCLVWTCCLLLSEDSRELDDEVAQQQQRQQAQLSLTAQLAELAARARAMASSREADAGSPAALDPRHRNDAQLALVRHSYACCSFAFEVPRWMCVIYTAVSNSGRLWVQWLLYLCLLAASLARLSSSWACAFLTATQRSLQAEEGPSSLPRSADVETLGLLSQRRTAHSPTQLQQQEQGQAAAGLHDSPDGLSHRPVHVHVIGHTQMPSQLQRQRQQQQGHSMMPRVANYHQSPSSMLQYQHYQPELAQSQQQYQYQQQHPDGLVQYQHQPGLTAMQHQQMHGGLGELMGPGMGHQLQDRGQYYGRAEHDAASQPVLPGNYTQVGRGIQCPILHPLQLQICSQCQSSHTCGF